MKILPLGRLDGRVAPVLGALVEIFERWVILGRQNLPLGHEER